MQKKTISRLIFISLIVIVLILTSLTSNNFSNNLTINEVSFANNNDQDWIEIYNPSLSSKSLLDYYLTDDKENYKKYRFKENLIIPPKSFLIIYGESADVSKDDIQLNFNIKNGETIYLVSQDQTIIDTLPAIMDESNSQEISIGRFPDGYSDLFEMTQPNPGQANIKDQLNNTIPNEQ